MRDLSPDLAAEFAAPNLMPCYLAQLYFDSGTIYAWTGAGILNWDGNDYIGNGEFVGLSSIEETQNLEAKGIVVSLNGIDSALLETALDEKVRGRRFVLFEAAMEYYTDSNGNQQLALVEEPNRCFSGLMNNFQITDRGTTADIRLTVENILIVGQRSKIRRYTSEDQKRKYPGDLGLDNINQLQDKELVW